MASLNAPDTLLALSSRLQRYLAPISCYLVELEMGTHGGRGWQLQQCRSSRGVEHRHERYAAARQRGGEHLHEVCLVREAFNFEMLPVPPRAGVQSGVHVQDPQESVRSS